MMLAYIKNSISKQPINAANVLAHQWQIFTNPRNGKIRVEACEVCGCLRSAQTLKTNCNVMDETTNNKMLELGWTTNRSAA